MRHTKPNVWDCTALKKHMYKINEYKMTMQYWPNEACDSSITRALGQQPNTVSCELTTFIMKLNA